MNELHSLVADALAAPLATARVHATTGTSIGYIGAEVPVEIIRASGAFALRLPARLLDSTDRADALLESSFMPQIRSVTEQYLRGEFDFLRALVFPRSNDSAQRLYYYLSEQQRNGSLGRPRLLIYDLAKIPRPASLRHTMLATEQLARDLGAEDVQLEAAVGGRNRRARLMARVTQRRVGGSVRGSEMERMARAAGFCNPDTFDHALENWLGTPAGEPLLGPRILLVGSAPPDDRLHRMVEEAGGNVIAELGEHAYCEVEQLTELNAAVELAAFYHSSPFGTRAFADRNAKLRQLVASSRVDGVIFWLVEEEDAFIWDLPSQRSALHQAEVRHLALSGRRWHAADGTAESIRGFVRALAGSSP